MRDLPVVSAIIPFLNGQEYIEEAIESVLAQTYDRWELWLVDDGSTDGSTRIARRYAAQHPRKIRYLEHDRHENRGASASRNLGIRHAHGEYVAFLDCDDVWLPEKLEQQVALLEAHPEAGMLVGASLYWHSWTGRPEDAERDAVVPAGGPQDALVRPPALLTTLYPLGRGAAPCPGSLLVRRRAIEAVEGFEENFHNIHQLYEDQVFLAKLYRTTSVFVTSLCTDRYRQHWSSCVSTVTAQGRYHEAREHFLTWFESYLEVQEERNPQVWQALHAALMPYRHPVRFVLSEFRQDPWWTLARLGRRAVWQARRLASFRNPLLRSSGP